VPEDGIYVYFRYNKGKTVMIVVNSNENEKPVVTSRFRERMNGFGKAIDVVSGTRYNSIEVLKIPAKNVWVLELQK